MLYDLITFHRVGSKNMFILPSLPSWVILTDSEAIAFKQFSVSLDRQKTIKSMLEYGYSSTDAKEHTCTLLAKLKDAGFHPLKKEQLTFYEDEVYPSDVHLCLTRGCNLRCKHCYISAEKEMAGEYSLEDWMIGFRSFLQYVDNPNITISGGEPTQKAFLPELIEYLSDKANVTLFTNGKRNIDKLVPYLEEVQVSLDGISAQTNDEIRGLGSFRKISKFIREFPDKQKLTVAITVMSHNFYHIRDNLSKFLYEHDIDNSNLRLNSNLEDAGRAEEMHDSFKSFGDIMALEIAEFMSTLKPDEPSLEKFTNKLNCGIGLSIGVDANGDIYPCDEFTNRLGNIKDINLPVILRKSVAINKETQINNMPYCQECDLKNICLGGCKAKNLQKNGSYFLPDCSETKKQTKYVNLAYEI